MRKDHSLDQTRLHWADGITEELGNAIARASAVELISPTSAKRFENSPQPACEIARHLNADAALQGSLVISDQKLALRVRVIEAFSESLLWSGAYEGSLDETIALQQQIAAELAVKLPKRIPNAAREPGFSVKRIDPNAYEACMKGRLFWGRRTEMDLEKSIDFVNRAAAIDPTHPDPVWAWQTLRLC